MNTEFRELRKYKWVNIKLQSTKRIKITVEEMTESEADVLVGDEVGPESQERFGEPALLQSPL